MNMDARPKLPRHVRMRRDATRDAWVILAPERVLFPDEIAVEILQLCDGCATVADIVGDLAARADAPLEIVRDDVVALLADLSAKGVIET
jgi:pyrroloquinoline quinone biosynthesis protein D